MAPGGEIMGHTTLSYLGISAIQRTRMATLLLGLLLASFLGGCATTGADRVDLAVKKLNQSQLLERLEQLSQSADQLMAVKEVFDNAEQVASMVKTLGASMGGDVLEFVLSKVGALKVAWEMLDSLEVMKQFWRTMDELRTMPRSLRAAVQAAQRDPSEVNLARFDEACQAATTTLQRAKQVAGTLKAWTRAANVALALAQGEIESLGRQLDFWGSSLLIEGAQKLVRTMGGKAVAAAVAELQVLEEQLESDLRVLKEVRLALKSDK